MLGCPVQQSEAAGPVHSLPADHVDLLHDSLVRLRNFYCTSRSPSPRNGCWRFNVYPVWCVECKGFGGRRSQLGLGLRGLSSASGQLSEHMLSLVLASCDGALQCSSPSSIYCRHISVQRDKVTAKLGMTFFGSPVEQCEVICPLYCMPASTFDNFDYIAIDAWYCNAAGSFQKWSLRIYGGAVFSEPPRQGVILSTLGIEDRCTAHAISCIQHTSSLGLPQEELQEITPAMLSCPVHIILAWRRFSVWIPNIG
mmetsp:Transcript_15303/g.26798  ORF Transcript_15303/g.26798 Transcript_15303/m.26798 type:complete len:254 (-) Transcript_15303:1068-1829(-)